MNTESLCHHTPVSGSRTPLHMNHGRALRALS